MIFLSRYFESSSFHCCLRVLSNMNYKFCYYCFFYLLSFEERKAFCVNRKTKKCYEYFKIDFDDCTDIETLELFFLFDEIILAIDFGLKKWNVILFQINFETSKNYSSCYESGLWTLFESRYNIIKQEYLELLKALKKICFWLYEIGFIIEIDVNILIVQLNRSAVNFSKILIICWLTWIHLFDFNVRHVLDKRYTATDEIFRRSREFSNDIDKVDKKNIDDFISDQFNCVRVCSMRINENDNEQFLKNEYFEKF